MTDVLLIAQIETARGLENVDAIAAVDGIDCPLDRALRPDELPRYPRPVYAPDLFRGRRAGAGGVPTSTTRCRGSWPDRLLDGEALLKQGFTAMAYSGDLWIYQTALRQGLDALRAVPNA